MKATCASISERTNAVVKADTPSEKKDFRDFDAADDDEEVEETPREEVECKFLDWVPAKGANAASVKTQAISKKKDAFWKQKGMGIVLVMD